MSPSHPGPGNISSKPTRETHSRKKRPIYPIQYVTVIQLSRTAEQRRTYTIRKIEKNLIKYDVHMCEMCEIYPT